MRNLICAVFFVAGLSAEEKVNLYTINRIKNEAFQNSKVMENAFYLTDVYGPRLTGSPGIQAAAGCAVTMEAIRILKTLDLPMPRTVRIALRTGEKQGLLGSKAYVKDHFADRETMTLKPEHARLSGYFNLDNGTGKIRGVYLQENDMMRPVFETWLAPFKDLGASTVTIRKTTGTDHLSFDAVGLPGFQFIQDPVEYSTRTHHSNMDVFDRLQQSDLMQASAILASVVYHAATRDQMLPRKDLPKPEKKRKDEENGDKPASLPDSRSRSFAYAGSNHDLR